MARMVPNWSRAVLVVALEVFTFGCDGEDPMPDDRDLAVDGADDDDDETVVEEDETQTCDIEGAEQDCDGGVQYCFEGQWAQCHQPECSLGDSEPCFSGEEAEFFGDLAQSCILVEGIVQWDWDACNTPLVLRFDEAPVSFAPTPAVSFDITGHPQACVSTDWPTAHTPWLAIDLDRSGSIDGGHELFGSGTVLSGGRHAKNGFAALGGLDSDADGRLTPADERFGEIVVWSDFDGDKRSTLWETQPLANRGIVAIDLGYQSDRRCDARGNCSIERASFEFAPHGAGSSGATRIGEVVDVHLACH